MITADRNDESITVRMDGYIHIQIVMDHYCALHAWMETAGGPWFIDFLFNHNEGFSVEYDDEVKWKKVLAELAKVL